MMHVGGWFDLFTLATVRNFEGMCGERGAIALWMGPWSHTSYERYHGDVDFGGTGSGSGWGRGTPHTSARRVDFGGSRGRGRLPRVLDEYLREEAPRSQPPYRYFLMGQNEWRAAWPLGGSPSTCGGEANSARGDGRLEGGAPEGDEPADRYLYDPERPVPTEGGFAAPAVGRAARPARAVG